VLCILHNIIINFYYLYVITYFVLYILLYMDTL
jgi:hypothetical protein